jgi:malonyl-CoA O-methyltransferase
MTMTSGAAGIADDPYREWAPIYPPSAHNALMRVEQRAMLSLLGDVAGRSVLDAGCGTGRYARLIAERGAARVICVDRSASMLQRAAATSHRIRADVARLPIASSSLDLVVSGLAIMDLSDLAGAFIEWSRVLHPGGAVLCSTLHPRGESLGWTRTFDTPAGTHRLPAHWHSVAAFRSACARASLQIDAIGEPALEATPSEPVAMIVRAHRRT